MLLQVSNPVMKRMPSANHSPHLTGRLDAEVVVAAGPPSWSASFASALVTDMAAAWARS
jgi:hypothetical protein